MDNLELNFPIIFPLPYFIGIFGNYRIPMISIGILWFFPIIYLTHIWIHSKIIMIHINWALISITYNRMIIIRKNCYCKYVKPSASLVDMFLLFLFFFFFLCIHTLYVVWIAESEDSLNWIELSRIALFERWSWERFFSFENNQNEIKK